MTGLHQIQEEIHLRTEAIATAHGSWPCRKGCDDCCRHLASLPRVTEEEWRLIAGALDALPAETAGQLRQRIRASAGKPRPVVCPLLDTGTGACLVYTARPVACRAYGFYAERDGVLGCGRVESVWRESPDIVWGNHSVLEGRLERLGPSRELPEWLLR